MKRNLIGRAFAHQFAAELLSICWEGDERYTSQDPSYRLFRLYRRKSSAQKIRWKVSDRPYLSATGLLIIPPGVSLTLEANMGEAIFVSCFFSPHNFEKIIALNATADELVDTCLNIQNPFICAVLDRLALGLASADVVSETLLEAVYACLRAEGTKLLPSYDSLKAHPGSLENWQVKEIRRLIEQSVEGMPFPTMEELAKSCAVSLHHMMKGFKRATGSTVYIYIRNVKAERAKALLTAEGARLPIRQVAKKLGFNSPSHFSAEFRRITGVAPSEYRLRQKSKHRI